MKRKVPGKMTKAEAEYVKDMSRLSAFEKVNRGQAQVLAERDYPEPLKRFLQRERMMVHVKLSRLDRQRLESLSRSAGLPVHELARRWIEQGLAREAG